MDSYVVLWFPSGNPGKQFAKSLGFDYDLDLRTVFILCHWMKVKIGLQILYFFQLLHRILCLIRLRILSLEAEGQRIKGEG